MEYKKRLAEIKDIIWENWYSNDVDDTSFMGIESELHDIHKATKDNVCLWLMSELYHFRAKQSKRKIAQYALMALETDPNNAAIHDNLTYGNNVRTHNFKDIDHNELIEFYRDFIDKHPDSLIAHRILLECLIDNYRFTEALTIIDLSRPRFSAKAFLWDLYHGEILFKTGNQEHARELWEQTCVENEANSLCFSMVAEYCANFGLYDDALTKYARAHELQKPPRKVDPLIGRYKIFDIKKEYARSLATIDRIIEVYKTDWDTESGIDIDDLIEEKIKIKRKMNN